MTSIPAATTELTCTDCGTARTCTHDRQEPRS